MKKKGQNLSEVTIVAVVVIGLCLLALFLFGDQLSNIFKKNYISELFGKNRTAISSFNRDFNASNLDMLAIGGNSGNDFEDTAGSGGLTYISLMQNYVQMLQDLLANLKIEGDMNFQEAIERLKAMNGVDATSSAIDMAKYLEFVIDFRKDGPLALQFKASLEQLIQKISDPAMKNLVRQYGESILNLASNLAYRIDENLLASKNLLDMKGQNIQQNTLKFSEDHKQVEFTNSKGQEISLTQGGLSINGEQFERKSGFFNDLGKGVFQLINSIADFFGGKIANFNPLDYQVYSNNNLFDNPRTYHIVKKSSFDNGKISEDFEMFTYTYKIEIKFRIPPIKIKESVYHQTAEIDRTKTLQNIVEYLNDSNISQEERDEFARKIVVYQEGDLNNILPGIN